MKYSDWSSLRKNLSEKYKKPMSEIALLGRKAERLLDKVEENLNSETTNYTVISETLDVFKSIKNKYYHFVGNIIYSTEDIRAKKSLARDIEIIEGRLDFEKSFFGKGTGGEQIRNLLLYDELRNILEYIYLVLNDARKWSYSTGRFGTNFEETLVNIVKLKSGLLQKKKYMPTPDEKLIGGSGEEVEEGEKSREEIEEETPEQDEGMDLFKEILEGVSKGK